MIPGDILSAPFPSLISKSPSPNMIPQASTNPKSRSKNLFPYLLDVVVRKRATILKLLSGEDQTLLVRGNALLVLDLRLDIVDRVAGLDLQSYGLAS